MTYRSDINTLLDLDGTIIEQRDGYWTKFKVKKLVNPTEERPHGIRYSLTLHDPQGNRVIGFDNAHAVKSKKSGRYRRQKTYDHWHRNIKDEGVSYAFIDAHKLLKDFWIQVDKTLEKLGIEEV